MLEEHEELISGLGGVLILLLLVLTVSTGIGAYNKIKESRHIGQEEKNTISVSGEGEIYADPDLAMVNFSVVTEKETVGRALQVNKKKTNTVIGRLKDQGIKEKDLKTTTFDLQPRYEWYEKTSRKEGKRKLMGYEVTQELQVKIRNLQQVGEIIQEATDAGANRVGNVQFTIEDKEAIKKKARKKAIEQAKGKAEKISSQLGVDLVKIVDFSENFYTPRFTSNRMMEAEQAKGGAAPEVQPGQNRVEVNVNVTYKIN